MIGIVAGDVDQHVVRQDRPIQKTEQPVLGGLDRGDVAGQSAQHLAQFLPRLAVQPPEPGITGAVLGVALGVALRPHPLQQPLIDRRIAVFADMLLQSRQRAEAQLPRLIRGDDEASTVEFDAR
jgi:hypothetical protein